MATPMPTGAKLVAAACFAVVGWVMSNYYAMNMPDASAAGPMREWAALIGAIIGWMVMGPSVGRGYVEAAGSGIKTAVVLAVAALFLLALREMLDNSVKMRYDGALDAILDVFQVMARRSEALLSLGVFGTILFGGIVGGLLSENAGRRWK
ncbi:TrgA family protein [Tabrizicola sp.]|uniref:TrgA family protein n=1 Tax=Tabrizicola sp. TaxID=2005166 RepID=UPI001A4C9AE2|nr:TrgA family protein [Tabrizicola sp.]MBL9061228.1 TrgA family protein [Tabrizicola sp.]